MNRPNRTLVLTLRVTDDQGGLEAWATLYDGYEVRSGMEVMIRQLDPEAALPFGLADALVELCDRISDSVPPLF